MSGTVRPGSPALWPPVLFGPLGPSDAVSECIFPPSFAPWRSPPSPSCVVVVPAPTGVAPPLADALLGSPLLVPDAPPELDELNAAALSSPPLLEPGDFAPAPSLSPPPHATASTTIIDVAAPK